MINTNLTEESLVTSPLSPVDHVPGEVVAKIRKGQVERFLERKAQLNIDVTKNISTESGDFVVVKTDSLSSYCLVDELEQVPEVEYAEPNYTNRVVEEKPQVKAKLLKNKKVNIDVAALDKKLTEPTEVSLADVLYLSNQETINLAEAVEAIDQATKSKVEIISSSWVRDGFSKALDEAIRAADGQEVSFISHPHHSSLTSSSSHSKNAASHVSAGKLSLYIAQEDHEIKSGRGRLIASENSSDHQAPSTSLNANHVMIAQNYSFPGAQYIKLEIGKFGSENSSDLITLRDAKGLVIKEIPASEFNYQTDYIKTDAITVEFTSSDRNATCGSVIRNVKVIY